MQILEPELKELQVVILAPTHELAAQTDNVVKNISHYMDNILLLVGGTSVEKNKSDIKKNKPQIVVGTPVECMIC